MAYHMKKDQGGCWYWIFVASNGKTIARSSESYHNESDCLHSIALVKASSNATVYKG